MYNYESDTNITWEKIRPRQLEKFSLTRFLYINRAHNNDCYYTSYLWKFALSVHRFERTSRDQTILCEFSDKNYTQIICVDILTFFRFTKE